MRSERGSGLPGQDKGKSDKDGETDAQRQERLKQAFSLRNADRDWHGTGDEAKKPPSESGEFPLEDGRPSINEQPLVARLRQKALEQERESQRSQATKPEVPKTEKPKTARVDSRGELAADQAKQLEFMRRIDNLTKEAVQHVVNELMRQSAAEAAKGKRGGATFFAEQIKTSTGGEPSKATKIEIATILLSIPKEAAEKILDELHIPK